MRLLALTAIALATAPVESNRHHKGHVRKHEDGKNKNAITEPNQNHETHKNKHERKHKEDAIVEESVVKESKPEKQKKGKTEKKEKLHPSKVLDDNEERSMPNEEVSLHQSKSIQVVDDEEEESVPEKGWRLWRSKEKVDSYSK
eukprot:scaffold10683_cov94-Cyclotella_meneghiniana.AAC.9